MGSVVCRSFNSRLLFLILSLVPVLSGAAQELINGGRHTGTIPSAGASQTWTFNSVAGANILLRVGSTNFAPRIRVLDNASTQIAVVSAGTTVTRDVVLPLVITNAGNYTVEVSSVTAATGAFALYYAQAPGEFSIPANDEGGTLASGASNAATITLGDLDLWRFNASAGNPFMLRMGGAFTPWIRVYNSSGALVAEAVSGASVTRDVVLSGVATNSGTYTVVASSTVSGGAGAYTLHLALAPAEVVTTSGDQGGDLINGAKTVAEIILGDLDVWRFTATAGDQVHLRMGGVFTPWIRLYGPNGEFVGEAVSGTSVTRDVLLERTATNSGVYIVVTSSTVASGGGAYELTLAKVPGTFTTSSGDQGGSLTNGVNTPGNLSTGDLDLWRFEASAGDAIVLRMGGAFTPKIQLYGPDGTLVEDAVSGATVIRDVFLEARAPQSGTYTAIASSTVASGAGDYTLHLAQSPEDFEVSADDEGGSIVSGLLTEGELHLGDMDIWSFEASPGESFMVRIGAEFAPWLRVYGPNGELAGAANSPASVTRDVVLNTIATNAGLYTVVVAATLSGGLGAYDLHLVRGRDGVEVSPGDEGGLLVNGATNIGTINLGDVDAWTFLGTVGDSNVFRITTTNFAPWIRLYGPSGTLVAESLPPATVTRNATLIYELTANPGEYTVVVSSGVSGQIGTFAFKQSRWAPDLIVPPNAAVDEGQSVFYTITSQDPDLPDKVLQFELLSAPSQAVFAVVGATNATVGWSTAEVDGPQTNVVTVKVTDVVNGRSFSRTNSFPVVIREINVAPELTVPPDQVIDELLPLTVAASATDIDLPANQLTFALIDPPSGLTINPTTGAINWTPTEAQGPSTNVIQVVVTDESPFAANETNLSDTNSFTIVVREVNLPPLLAVPAAQTFDELTPLNVTVNASDSDLPPNAFTFSLIDPPAGMTINPSTGTISWTPAEQQGPATLQINVRVTDSNPLAANSPQLSTTNSFSVTVWEVNVPPVVTVPAPQTVNELELVTLQASATDADAPANALTFALLTPPAGMTIAATNGTITWTPSESQGGTTNLITVVVTDSNPQAGMDPVLSSTNRFTVIVTEVNSAPTLTVVPAQNINEETPLIFTNNATDSDLPQNSLTYLLADAPTNATISAQGVISWTPNEAQGPGIFTFTTVVTDNGAPARSATNTFIATVAEVNIAPEVEAIPPQFARFGETWTNLIVATDTDLPANTLSYALVSGPSNLVVNAQSGSLVWVPVQAQVGQHSVTVRVGDNGSPAATNDITFQITVTGVEMRLEVSRPGAGLMQVTIFGNAGVNYRLERSDNLSNWEQQFEFRLNSSPFQYIDPDSISGRAQRFYRLRSLQ